MRDPIEVELLVYIRLITISLVLCLPIMLSSINSLRNVPIDFSYQDTSFSFSENRCCEVLLQACYK